MNLPANFKSEFKALKELAYDMNILLVEDDKVLQDQITKFLSKIFSKICVANHETVAMLEYEKDQYDIIISDLNTCDFNCIDLAKEIKKINPFQNILVFSDDIYNSKLIELINIGIDGFLLKPIQVGPLVSQLKTISHKIYEYKIVHLLSEILEEENNKLEQKVKNQELIIASMNKDDISNNETTKILNKATCDISSTTRVFTEDEEALLYTRRRKMSAEEFFDTCPFELEKTSENLEELESSFYHLLSKSKENIDHQTLCTLTEILKNFAEEISLIPEFAQLAYGIQELGITFESLDDHSKLANVMPMVASLFDNLEKWRRGVFYYKDVDDIHYMDNSIISDSISLQGFLSNSHSQADSEMELF